MRVLFILSRFPYPLEKGDKLRAYQHITNMHNAGIEVHIAAISDCKVNPEWIEKLKPFCASIQFIEMNRLQVISNLVGSMIRNLPLQVGYFYSDRNQKFIDETITKVNPDLIYCQLIRTALYIRKVKSIPKVIDYQDAFSKGTRQRTNDAPFFLKPLFNREIKLVDQFEREVYQWFDSHIIISEQDRLSLTVPKESPVHIIPNGVDTHFFYPVKAEVKFDITFVGNMNYPPNVDGAKYLVQEIMPLVWKELPSAKVQIAGASPSKEVKNLENDRVTVTGWVEDIRDCYSTSKIFIAPMRIGTGLQNKLLEAMAMRIPCVTTPISFLPLGAEAGKDILVGSSKEELSSNIIRLLNDENLRNNIGNNGLDFVTQKYSMNFSREQLKNLLEQTLQSHSQTC